MPASRKRWQTVRPWLPPNSASTSSTTDEPSLATPRQDSPDRSSNNSSSRRSSIASEHDSISSPSSSSSCSISSSSTCSTSSTRSTSPLRLKVLDVTSTAVVLSITTTPSSSSSRKARKNKGKEPTISIQLNGQDWSRVAHAGPTTTSTSNAHTTDEENDGEMTVIVYGLQEGKEYEIALELIKPSSRSSLREESTRMGQVATGDESEEARRRTSSEQTSRERLTVDVETPLTATSASTNANHDDQETTTVEHASTSQTNSYPTTDHSQDPSSSSHATPEGPPPPYSPPLPEPVTETSLRALLKKIRASSKRTESVLQSSIVSLKKNVEKGLKEDQRARTRIVGLEEAIRKAGENERSMREEEKLNVEGLLDGLKDEEEDVREELRVKKEGGNGGASVMVTTAASSRKEESPIRKEVEEDGGGELGVGELTRELETLNKRIEEKEKEERKRLEEAVKGLEHELGQLDQELIQLDREETHRYHLAMQAAAASAMNLSSDSLVPSPTASIAPSSSSSGFNLRWRRNAPPGHIQPPPPPPVAQPPSSNADPRTFGRFWRRTQQQQTQQPEIQAPQVSVSPTGSSSPRGSLEYNSANYGAAVNDRQHYAQLHQALWGSSTGPVPPTSAIDIPVSQPPSTPPSTISRRVGASLLRRKSSVQSNSSSGAAGVSTLPSVNEGGKLNLTSQDISSTSPSGKSMESNGTTGSSSGAGSGGSSSWGTRIGSTWSSVVARRGGDGKTKGGEKEEPANVEGPRS